MPFFFASFFASSASSSAWISASICAPRLGSFPCIRAGNVGSSCAALASASPLPESESFCGFAAAKRLPMERSSSTVKISIGQGRGELTCEVMYGKERSDRVEAGRNDPAGETYWNHCLCESFSCPLQTALLDSVSSLNLEGLAGHLPRRLVRCQRWTTFYRKCAMLWACSICSKFND